MHFSQVNCTLIAWESLLISPSVISNILSLTPRTGMFFRLISSWLISFYVHFKFLSLDTLKIGFILFAETDMNVLKIEIKLNLLRVLFIDKTLAAIFFKMY